ncbi:hypothetical protein OHB14_36470 [Streptomyces sp. NBC_01613]|uniref:hypothetical protein n=1 Tax=Streptomyces sp. NBC_01613 TaxID=2975896 RepID=UPI00386D53CC
MSTLEALAIIAAILAFSLPAAYWQIRRACHVVESERDRIIRAAHERAEAARLLDPITLAQSERTYQAYADGRARLLAAVREEQQKQKGEL